MHQERCGRDLIAAVFVGECGGLFDGRKMLCGGRCVNMTHLNTRRRRGLDVALSWKTKTFY